MLLVSLLCCVGMLCLCSCGEGDNFDPYLGFTTAI